MTNPLPTTTAVQTVVKITMARRMASLGYAMPNTLRTAERAYGMYDKVYQRNARYSRTTKTGNSMLEHREG